AHPVVVPRARCHEPAVGHDFPVVRAAGSTPGCRIVRHPRWHAVPGRLRDLFKADASPAILEESWPVTKPSAAEHLQGMYLPRPPDSREKYEYFGRQRRWVFAWLLIASAGVLYGYIHVAERAWAVSPLMWLLLMVMVPPVVVNFWLRIGRPRLTLAENHATASK